MVLSTHNHDTPSLFSRYGHNMLYVATVKRAKHRLSMIKWICFELTTAFDKMRVVTGTFARGGVFSPSLLVIPFTGVRQKSGGKRYLCSGRSFSPRAY
jgi:hypothetical protein